MNPKLIAGISGAASLALLGLLGFQPQNNKQHSISRRAISIDGPHIDISENDTVTWNEANYLELLKDIHLDITLPDVKKKAYTGNWSGMKKYQPFDDIHDDMMAELNARLATGGVWADNLVTNQPASYPTNTLAGGTCEWASDVNNADENGCAFIAGMDNTSPRVTSLLSDTGCDNTDYQPFVDDDNTNVWFLIPRAIPLWAADPSSHITEWQKYFQFVKGVAEAWWQHNNGGMVRLSIGLYTTGVQLIPRGIKMSSRAPLDKLGKWYQKPAMTAAKPRFGQVFRVLNQNIGTGSYVPNSGNGVLDGTNEDRDNCYALVFIQDVPRDLVSLHLRDESGKKIGNYVDNLNSNCNMNYAFVMPGANTKGSDADKYISKMQMVLQPNMVELFPWDPDFSGFYRLDSFDDMLSDAFKNHVQSAMCLQSTRQQCKLRTKGFMTSPTQAPSYEGETEGGYDYGDEASEYDYGAGTAEYVYEPGVYGGMTDDERAITEEPVPPSPQCCGGNLYNSKTFDNNKKECIQDYSTETYGVKSRE